MVYTDRSGDTYFLTGFLSLLGYCLYGIFLFIHGNCMVVGFLSGGECCTCGGRISQNFSATNSVTDSAAAGTALATGKKTYNHAISVNEEKNAIQTVAEKAKKAGKKVGVTTSVSVDHATPAAFYADQPDRNMYYLRFVHADIWEGVLKMGQNIRIIFQNGLGVDHLVIIIHPPALPQRQIVLYFHLSQPFYTDNTFFIYKIIYTPFNYHSQQYHTNGNNSRFYFPCFHNPSFY